MSVLSQIKIPFNSITVQTITVMTVATSIITFGLVSRYWKRRRKRPTQTANSKSNSNSSVHYVDNEKASKESSCPSTRAAVSIQMTSSSSESVIANHDLSQLSPRNIGVLGIDALETCINFWEDALKSLQNKSSIDVKLPDEVEFCHEVDNLLEVAYKLKYQCEYLFLEQERNLFRTENFDSNQTNMHSTEESFASAQDQIADLSEFEELSEMLLETDNIMLFKEALKYLELNGIPHRSLRTELMRCGSDVEYLGKLHCIRSAFQYLFKNPEKQTWFADITRQILTDLMLQGNKDPKDFLIAFEDMLTFVQDNSNHELIEEELSVRKVKLITFYDVALDYILLDAFEDLESPPSSVVAVVQNRWLSNSFKETALTTAIWSVLKAKRRLLKYSNGFRSRFYAISEQIIPLMAWGFLGPDENLKEMCNYFKNEMMEFFISIYDFQKCRYTTTEDLCEDIRKLLEDKINNISKKLMTR